jgi:hypothetical protein
MTDIAAKAAGTLTETAVKAVAKKAKTAVAKQFHLAGRLDRVSKSANPA